ncbi:MAG: thioredoxin family protein [Myxococcota bacterium]
MALTGVGSSVSLNNYAQPADNVQTVTAVNFQNKVLNAPGPVAVEFMSYGCIHCKKAEPFVQEAAGKLAGKVTVFRVNVPSQPALAQQYGIEGTPTFVMFKNGQEVGRSVGPTPSTESFVSLMQKPFGK